MSGTGMLLWPTEYEDEEGHGSKRRQFIHCQWAPPGATNGEGEPGVVGTVGKMLPRLCCHRASGICTDIVCLAFEP